MKITARNSGVVILILSVIGGVPRYLEEIKSDLSAEDNIKNLCFKTSGILSHEFDDILCQPRIRTQEACQFFSASCH